MKIHMKTRKPTEVELEALAEYNTTILWQDVLAEGDTIEREDMTDASWEMLYSSAIYVVDSGQMIDGTAGNGTLIFVEWGLCAAQLEVFFVDKHGKLAIIARYCPDDESTQEMTENKTLQLPGHKPGMETHDARTTLDSTDQPDILLRMLLKQLVATMVSKLRGIL